MINHLVINPEDSQAGSRLASALRSVGLVTLEGVDDRTSLLRLAAQVMRIRPHRDSDPDGITCIEDRAERAHQPGSAGLGNGELAVHTESSALNRPPRLMLMACVSSAATGGQCRFVDGARLYDELAARDPDLLDALLTPQSALFGGATGHLGAVFSKSDGSTIIRFRLDDLVRFSPRITRRLNTLHAILDELEVGMHLSAGNGYLLSNTRWLHGRGAFTGPRLMYRLLGDPLPSVTMVDGFVGRPVGLGPDLLYADKAVRQCSTQWTDAITPVAQSSV